jgi:hypothetical protein
MAAIILFSAAMGWCGTPWPGWWRKRKPGPPPPPDWFEYFEQENYTLKILTGIIGGIAGGLIINATAGFEQLAVIGLAALSGGRILSDLVSGIRNLQK